MTFTEFISQVAFKSKPDVVKYYRVHYPELNELDIENDIEAHCKTAGITFWNLLTPEEVEQHIDILSTTFSEDEISPDKILESIKEDVRYYNTIALELGLTESSKTISDFDFSNIISHTRQSA